MALQWMILTYIVAAEAAIAFLVTLPSPKAIKTTLVSLVSLVLQPALFVVPFSAFQLLDIYWKNEHRLMCSGETCTASERDRYEKTIDCEHLDHGDHSPRVFKSRESHLLGARSGLLLISLISREQVLNQSAGCIYRVCKYHKEIQSMEEVEKRDGNGASFHSHLIISCLSHDCTQGWLFMMHAPVPISSPLTLAIQVCRPVTLPSCFTKQSTDIHQTKSYMMIMVHDKKDGKRKLRSMVKEIDSFWCGPCKVIAPKFKKLAEEHLDVVFLKLDCNKDNRALAKELGLKVVPTFKI
ncbi:thioredoxin F-type 1 [Tanacetum coccineum]